MVKLILSNTVDNIMKNNPMTITTRVGTNYRFEDNRFAPFVSQTIPFVLTNQSKTNNVTPRNSKWPPLFYDVTFNLINKSY